MIKIKTSKDQSRLKRLALNAQGLLQSQPFGRGLTGTYQAISYLGYIQIDSISVVERAHHHVIKTRVPGFKKDMLQDLLIKGDIFEYWSHAAAFLPITDFRYSLPYKHAIKNGQVHWFKDPDKKLMAELLERIRIDGPLRSRDADGRSIKSSGWWDWKPTKKALEQLYMQGDLMVCDREGFQKTYDLTERVLPDHVNTSIPTTNELAEHLFAQQLRCHGAVSLKGLTYQRRNHVLRQAMKNIVDQRLAEGLLDELKLNDGQIYFIEQGALDRRMPRLNNRLLILSPFDNCVIQRERLKSLFAFDYQVECYLPQPKRKYGYFSLPLLYRGEFIGRIDCKTHRKDQQLEVKSLHFESHPFEQEEVNQALNKALNLFCKFQGCVGILVPPKYDTLF